MTLTQEGERVTGTYRSQYALGEVNGNVQGDEVALHASVGYHTRAAHYALKGTLSGDVMAGTFPIGPYNIGQWRAERIK